MLVIEIKIIETFSANYSEPLNNMLGTSEMACKY
jgi:hypothetical protein